MQNSHHFRIAVPIAFVTITAMLISACGSGNNESSSSQPEKPAPATDTAVFSPGPCASAVQGQVIRDITVAEADSLIKADSEKPCFVLLDIRTAQEFEAGHLVGAVDIDYRDSTFAANIDRLDRNATYLLYCRTAHRTTLSLPLFKEKGFVEVYNMLGGITQWKQDGLQGVVDAKGNQGDVITVQ